MEYVIIAAALVAVLILAVIAVLFLKLFDRIAGRGPGQVSKGMREYDRGK